MYENGKAIGGEGHPTNADEITFNNEDTDLVSEEVESAIKEVNAKFDRGSVSVTSDGVKTYAGMFATLYALIDTTKVSEHSKVKVQGAGATVFSVSYYDATQIRLGNTASGVANALSIVDIRLSATANDCHYDLVTIDSNGTATFSNADAQVVSAGRVFTFYY